jgi:hypothetical protein
VGLYTSIALSPEGRPVIAAYDFGNKDLRISTLTSSGWATRTIDSKGEVGLYPSLAFEPGWPEE